MSAPMSLGKSLTSFRMTQPSARHIATRAKSIPYNQGISSPYAQFLLVKYSNQQGGA